MSLDVLDQMDFDYNHPAFNTMDHRFTMNCHHTFSSKCSAKLAKHAIKGRGYFIEADEEYLRTLMDNATEDEDWVSVANYAMMLEAKRQYTTEREAWAKANELKCAPFNDDEPF